MMRGRDKILRLLKGRGQTPQRRLASYTRSILFFNIHRINKNVSLIIARGWEVPSEMLYCHLPLKSALRPPTADRHHPVCAGVRSQGRFLRCSCLIGTGGQGGALQKPASTNNTEKKKTLKTSKKREPG